MTTIDQERLSRRNFLKLAGLTALGVGLAACLPKSEKEEASAVSPPPTQQSPGAAPDATVAPAETAHVQATPSPLETKEPTATPDIATYHANFKRYIENNGDLTPAQIQQYSNRLEQIRSNPAELAAYNAAAAKLIADRSVVNADSLIPAPEALTTDPINPVFAIWEFNLGENKWVNFVHDYQLDNPTQPGLRVMMQPPIDDPLHHWSDWPRGDRAFVVPPPKGTNAGVGEFDYDTFSFITENAAKIPAPHQLLIPVLYKNGQIVAKQLAVQVYEGGIPLTEQVERNGTTITRYVYRREWTATQDVSTTNETVELTPQQIALADLLTQCRIQQVFTSEIDSNSPVATFNISTQTVLRYNDDIAYNLEVINNTTATGKNNQLVDLNADYFIPQLQRIIAHGELWVFDAEDPDNSPKIMNPSGFNHLDISLHFITPTVFPSTEISAGSYLHYFDDTKSSTSHIKTVRNGNSIHVFIEIPQAILESSESGYNLLKVMHAAMETLTESGSTSAGTALRAADFGPDTIDGEIGIDPRQLIIDVLYGNSTNSTITSDDPLQFIATKT